MPASAPDYVERLVCPVPGHGSWPVRLNDSDVPRCGRYPEGEMCRREMVVVRYVPEAEVERLRAWLHCVRLEREARDDCADSKIMHDYAVAALNGEAPPNAS